MHNENLLNFIPTKDLVRELVSRKGVSCNGLDEEKSISVIYVDGKDVFDIYSDRWAEFHRKGLILILLWCGNL
jgi:hypothetical protein